MIALGGYFFSERVAHGRTTIVWRGTRRADGAPIIAKALDMEFPTPFQLARMRHEYEILRSLDHPGVIKVHSLERLDRSLAIIMEDFDGVPLRALIAEGSRDLKSKLSLARRIVEILDYIHAAGIIHKDVNPNNILVNPTTGAVKIIDFGAATQLRNETTQLTSPNGLEGTLAYIAPEQTGRMNRPVDYRSDFYSLGITLYELFLGKLPFEASDSIEYVHLHMASVPPRLDERDPAIPAALAAVVHKLIEKNAENRYRSAVGIGRDLETCLAGASEDFVPGRSDPSSRFTIPSKLYGREAEINRLTAAYEAACAGRPSLVFTTGYSGVGKSALINELHRPIAQRSGIFIAGKFDQFRRDIPYSSVLHAFQTLLHQILAESEARIEAWKARLLEALAGNGAVIVDVLPELQHIIGPQPALPELAPQEAQNRFNLTFVNFIRTFAHQSHPLVLFLDDLQWADNASLKLLELLSQDRECRHLLILGAYRDNEVDAAHPLSLTIDRLKKAGMCVDQITLGTLPVGVVAEMVSDTVNRPPAEIGEVAELVYRKTDGNPFFIGQLLKSLHDGGQIVFCHQTDAWTWDIEAIRDVGISDNVAELMAAKIMGFAEHTRHLLQIAACIGNQFGLDDLSVVAEASWDSIAEGVLPALNAELIAPIGSEYRFYGGAEKAKAGDFAVRYRFLHDRVQQAAYDLLDESEKTRTHFKAGLLLLQNTPEAKLGEKLFEIVNHFNQSVALAIEPELRLSLSRLNLRAAIKAKNAAAYEPALRYAKAAEAFLDVSAESQLRFGILVEQGECEYLTGNDGAAECLYALALEQAADDSDRAFVYERMVHYYTNTGKFADAYETGRKALRLFGVSLPARFTPPLFIKDLLQVKLKLRGRKVASLVELPVCQDERMVTAMRLIAALLKAAYQLRPELCVACATKAVNLSLTHGTMEDNAVAYLVFGGIFLGGVMGDRRAGYEFGRLALAMNARFNNARLISEITFVSTYFTIPWIEPAAQAESYYEAAYRDGLQTGDFFHSSCASCALIENQFLRGVPLPELRQAAEGYLAFLTRIKSHEAAGAIKAVLQTIRNLEGATDGPASLADHDFDEAAFVEQIDGFTSKHFAHFYYVDKMQALYLWGLYDEALKLAELSKSYLKYSLAMLHTAEHHFLHGLVLCAMQRRGAPVNLRKVRGILRKLDHWAKLNPANFEHKAQLLRAELTRCGRRPWDAAPLYAAAIRSAHQHGFIHIEALANELAGRFFVAQKAEMAASGHLRAALYGYLLWGARGVADKLVREFPHLSLDEGRDEGATLVDGTTTRTGGSVSLHSRSSHSGGRTHSRLDIETVIKATRALSGEIKLSSLLQKLVEIMIENAGAERGAFVRLHKGALQVAASGKAGQQGGSAVTEAAPDPADLPLSIIQYVARLGEIVLLNDAQDDRRFWNDPYIQAARPKSLLCAPVMLQNQVIGVIYLENNLTNGAFTTDRLAMLEILAAQAAISLENSVLYAELEHRVAERTSELLKTTAKLEAADKAKSQFLATMSHEIRTPMTGIQGMLDLLQNTELDSDQREMVSVVRDSASALLTIINDILDFSKIEAGKMQLEYVPVSLPDLVESVAEVLAPTAFKKRLDFAVVIEPAVPHMVAGDPVRLRQILFNLIGNAIKFTAEGSVVVRLRQLSRSDSAVSLRLSIADSGIGIDAEAKERLFRPFAQADETTTRRFGGTGLGLSICRHLVDLMGGAIWVDSEPGKGSTFHVELTLVRVDQPAEPPPGIAGVRLAISLKRPPEAEAARFYLGAAGAALVPVDDDPQVLVKDGEDNAGGGTVRVASATGGSQLSRPLRRAALLRAVSSAIGAAAAPKTTRSAPPPASAEAAQDGKRILVAEDNAVNQIVIKRLLQVLGRNADLVGNGRLALEAWRTGRYAVLLSDCHMPEMDGFTLTRTIRAEEEGTGRRTPIIAFTAAATSDEVAECSAAGMDDFLSKPIDVERLKAVLARWLDTVSA